jgi:hypothetical protein
LKRCELELLRFQFARVLRMGRPGTAALRLKSFRVLKDVASDRRVP